MSSNSLGPMIAPILFAAAIAAFGWRKAFYLVSIPGFLTALAVYWYLRDTPAEHPHITARELAEIGTAPGEREKLPYSKLLTHRALWQLFFIYMTWDAAWWGFQAWLPSYLVRVRGFTLLKTGAVTALPFAAGFVGILAFSYISERTGRRKTMLVSALLGSAFFLALTATATNAPAALVFLTATGFFLPAIHGPFWSWPMDLLPSGVMGYSSGFINTGGQLAGIASPIIIGALIQLTSNFHAGFIFMAMSVGVSAVLVLTLRDPKIRLGTPVAAGAHR